MKIILLQVADPTAAENDGNTAPHIATAAGHADCLRALVENNASVNHVNKEGDSPLSIALELKHKACGEILLAAGARPPKNIVETAATMMSTEQQIQTGMGGGGGGEGEGEGVVYGWGSDSALRIRFRAKLKVRMCICIHTGFFKHVQNQKMADEVKKTRALFKGKIAPEDVKCSAPGCHKLGTKKCGACKSVAYCSKQVRGERDCTNCQFPYHFHNPKQPYKPNPNTPPHRNPQYPLSTCYFIV